MKKIFSILLSASLFSLAFLSSCNSSGGEAEVTKPEVFADSSTDLAIEGMMCIKGCVGIITSTLKKTHGVGEFEIFFEEGRALIAYDSKQITESEIIDVIQSIADGAYVAYPYVNEAEETEEAEEVEEVTEE
jgi:copper chaperone CopZ